MEVTFWGVRGSIPSPGPGTVRYGGNTSCVTVRLGGEALIVLDCGTGARNLGLQLMGGAFGQGRGRASVFLSHAHWDHIQGFPFFVPFYVPGNVFTVYGAAQGQARLEQVLERQMAAQFFPVQTTKNMAASLQVRAIDPAHPVSVDGAHVWARENPHGSTPALAFRIEHQGSTVVYASDAGYGPEGPPQDAVAFYQGADLLIHDSTYTPEDRQARLERGLSSLDEAVDCAVRARVRRLGLFHFDQDYTDSDVDQIVLRGRRQLAERGAGDIEIFAAAEGLSLKV